MKNYIIYSLCLLLMVGGFSACKRVKSVQEQTQKTTVYEDGTVITESYMQTPPQDQETKNEEVKEQEEESPKRLSKCKAKRLLRKQLRKADEERLTASIRVGYYECNDYAERLNLMKLAANKLITLKCDEIVTSNGPTYWVTVDLTWRGWYYKESPDKPEFPEDCITEKEARAFLFPKLDQDEWGVPTTDTLVPAPIKEAVRKFYAGLQAGQDYHQSLVDAKMVCAMSLLDSLASYGVNKLNVNPFTRGVTLTKEMVEQISVLRMPRLQNAYLVMVGENNFLYVINAENEVIIEDLAYLAIEDMKSLDQTVCSLAGKLTKEEMIMAREMKRQRDAYEEQVRKAMAQMPQDKQQSESEKNKEDFEMCATAGGLMPVEHDDPTLYELAKKAEHFEEVELLGAVIRISDIDELVTMGNKKEAYASAVATYKVARVNAVGRIYLGLTDGNTEEKTVGFIYTNKNGWELE